MINTYSYSGDDFKSVFTYGEWKIGLLKYSKRFSSLGVWERHILTAEVFVLLSGTATLYGKQNDGKTDEIVMQTGVVYEVPVGEWHHIVVSHDATVLVVENSNTDKENTQKIIGM